MSNEPPPLSPKICTRCRAANYAHLKECFLCHAPLSDVSSSRLVTAVPAKSPAGNDVQERVETVFLWVFVALAMLLFMVGVGLAQQDRGLLSLYLVVVIPAMAAAGVRALFSVSKGETPKASKMLGTFIVSALLALGIGAMLIIACVVLFFITCAQMFAGGGPMR